MSELFMKNESLLISEIEQLYQDKKYELVASKRNAIFENLNIYKNSSVISKIVYSLFITSHFEEIVTMVTELNKNEINEYEHILFCLASLIALDDIYMAKSFIKKNKILSSTYSKEYLEEDGANYSSILSISDINEQACYLLANYVVKYDDEGISEDNFRILKFYEMIDTIYSLGYPKESIEYMTLIGEAIFR